MPHPSASEEQRAAQAAALARLGSRLGVKFDSDVQYQLPGGATVEVDGWARTADGVSLLVEVYAHVGKLRGAQSHKIARDAVKLHAIGRTRRKRRLILLFVDRNALPKGWLAQAITTMGIECCVVSLPDRVKECVLGAQERQKMVNPGEEDELSADAIPE